MDITIDFTKQDHLKLEDLEKYPYLRSITFVLHFFKELNKSFSCLYEFISFLNDKPLVKIFVKPSGQQIKPKYKTIAVGGTFDHLHIGHQMILLYSALLAQKKLIVGVTSDQMLVKKMNKDIIQSLLMRINQVRQFLTTLRPDLQLQIFKLDDPYGPTIHQKDINALIVSYQTIKGGQQINKRRIEKGFPQLTIQICPIMAPIQNLTSIQRIQNKISSTHIRSHILNKNGLTLQRYSQYQNVWNTMIKRIYKILQIQQKDNILISKKYWDVIVKYYSQYWRFFHTNHHIAKMFRDLNNILMNQYQKLSEIDKIVLQISIFFHDIIYRPDIKTNEEQSSKFAQCFIKQISKNQKNQQKNILKEQIIKKVKAAILCTIHHKSQTQVQKILCELDMSVLDQPLEKYKTYAFNIEKQYRPLHHQQYPFKRLQFLQKIQKGKYHYYWRKGQNLQKNIQWQINYWHQHITK